MLRFVCIKPCIIQRWGGCKTINSQNKPLEAIDVTGLTLAMLLPATWADVVP